MTVVIAIQVLAARLAGGVLFERRLHRGGRPSASLASIDASAIEFHPELLVRWDDEGSYTESAHCDRRTSTDRRVHVHPQPLSARSHMHIR